MNRKIFKNKQNLDAQMVDDILIILKKAIDLKGEASVLFSGGSTPKGMLSLLSKNPFDWSKVKIGLVDDRMIDVSSEFSNARMIMEDFISNLKGVPPSFYPLVFAPKDEGTNFDDAMNSVFELGIPDLVILGMGTDGHFASLFPKDECSEKGLSPERKCPLVYTQAPSYPKNRISYSWSYLRKAKHIWLHITGQEKQKILNDSLKREIADKLPIDTVINDSEIMPELYWAP